MAKKSLFGSILSTAVNATIKTAKAASKERDRQRKQSEQDVMSGEDE